VSLSVCAQPRCPSLVPKGQTRCERHRKEKRRREDKRRPSAAKRGYDAKWRKTRAAYLKAFPICEEEHGCIEWATDVHHLDGLGPMGPRGHDWENLQALCHRHHSEETARSQPGGWR
jgi:5-methylcytosine-specific restriction protein A